MDAALLIIAGNMSCPQPQTSEHLAAVDIMQLNHIIIVQNKIDIIFKDESAAKKNYEEIKKLIPELKKKFSSSFMTSLQKNAEKEQKWPLLNLVCQFGFHRRPRSRN